MLNKTTDSTRLDSHTHNLQRTQFTLHTFAGIKGLILLIPLNEITVCANEREREKFTHTRRTQFKYNKKRPYTFFLCSQFSVNDRHDRCSSSSNHLQHIEYYFESKREKS